MYTTHSKNFGTEVKGVDWNPLLLQCIFNEGL